MTHPNYPLQSLKAGHWFKLICGASYQHLPAIRNLTLAYTLAGADCIDVSADPGAIASAQEALSIAVELCPEAQQRGFAPQSGESRKPLLMVSLNDGEDPHFRKAEFDPNLCPSDCLRPCEWICPAQAIAFSETHPSKLSGVIDQRCYGCGRCIPVCPSQIISARSYVSTPDALLFPQTEIDALEIHTQVGHLEDFRRLWQTLRPGINRLKLIAISFPDDANVIDYLYSLYDFIQPLPCPLIWQTDGRPMSGDIGAGTTHASIKLAHKVLTAGLPGFIQLAGGTNPYTVTKLQSAGLLHTSSSRVSVPQTTKHSKLAGKVKQEQKAIAGIAYGSYARVLLAPVIDQLEARSCQQSQPPRLENHPDLLWQAVTLADSLISPLKTPMKVSESLP